MTPPIEDRVIIGMIEEVEVGSGGLSERLQARVDTGATKSSVDYQLASRLKLGPVIESKLVKSAHGNKLRPIIEAPIRIRGTVITAKFTLADREHMKYKVLIGQNILKKGFLIDPNR
ncbi:ATP-dependent zinc protease [Candidatus Woesearchaeota archaeon]|nr:ATP-dependent zinc protease [Candidatus Woesearchaeota archaeon]